VRFRLLVLIAGYDLPGQIQGRRQSVGDGPEFANVAVQQLNPVGWFVGDQLERVVHPGHGRGGVTPFGFYDDARLLISKREDL
jgi:hypothetical protein